MVSPCGDDFFVGATFGRPHGLYNSNLAAPRNGLSRAPAPTASSGKIALLGAGAQLWSAMPIPHS